MTIRPTRQRLATVVRRAAIASSLLLWSTAGNATFAGEGRAVRNRPRYQPPTIGETAVDGQRRPSAQRDEDSPPAKLAQPSLANLIQTYGPDEAVRTVGHEAPQAVGSAAIDDAKPVPKPIASHRMRSEIDMPHSSSGGCSCGSYGCDGGCLGVSGALDGCDAMGCDAAGCDAMSGCSSGWADFIGVGSVGRLPRWNCWQADAELLLWWRQGQELPSLVTTSPDGTAEDDAGDLSFGSTRVLFGNDTIGQDLSNGGRFQLTRWLDRHRSRALSLRVWGAGRQTFGFSASNEQNGILARPFFNVTDGQSNQQDAQLIAFPGESIGSIDIGGSSEVFGGDLTMRYRICENRHRRWDFLWGYEVMRINESLRIGTDTTVTDTDGVIPLGSQLLVDERFATRNEFHGGVFGLETARHRGCWTLFYGARVAFGSVNREAVISGQTTTSIDGQMATDGQGLLTRSTNIGRHFDSVFAVIPEANVRLAYRWRERIDLSIGYNYLALTNVLQPGTIIDRDLAVNLASPDGVVSRPDRQFRDSDYWLQGLQFGMHWNY
jgi:hypothetical protein